MGIQGFDWVGDWAGMRARLTSWKEAVYDFTKNRRYTYRELNERACRLANFFISAGMKKGDRIATLCRNNVESIDIFFACGKLGLIFVPLNLRLSDEEMEFLLKDSAPRILFYDPEFLPVIERFKEKIRVEKTIETGLQYEKLLASQPVAEPPRPYISFDDPHMILYTGGTTGLPKGALISHGMIFWNSVNTIVSWGLHPDDVTPLLFPFFHTGGWNVITVPIFHIGGRLILTGAFNPDEIIEIIEKEKATIVIGVPTMFHMIMNSPKFENAKFDSVRFFISGGGACPIPVMERYWAKGKVFKMGYGLTEVGPNNFYLPDHRVKEKPLSVGLPVAHCQMRIVDEDEKDVKKGEIGELLIRGPHGCLGYWQNPKATEELMHEGWYHTGDLAKQDEEGFYYIVDRKKDMYKSGGENVYPIEIENVLYQNPKIDQVAVIGVPDEKWGEVGKAVIVLKKGEKMIKNEMIEWCKEKLGKYKIPKYAAFVESLPKSPAGKILKREIKKLYGEPKDE